MATKTVLGIILLLVAGLGSHAQTPAQDRIVLGQSIVTTQWSVEGPHPQASEASAC